MANRIHRHSCENCGALVLIHDERNGKVIYYGKVLQCGEEGQLVATCPKCKRSRPLPSWNPLVLEKTRRT